MLTRSSVLVLLVILVVTCVAPAVAQDEGADYEIAVVRYVEHGRLLVEMRALFEWLGWMVEWNPWEHRIDATNGVHGLTMWIDNAEAWVNGGQYWLDVPARLRYGKTYVPLRFVAEATGCQVDYYGSWVQINDGANTMIVHIVD